MNRKMSYAIAVVFLILTACSHNIEKFQNNNYIPPTIKNQPKMYYPVMAQENSYYGVTKVVVMISKEGRVTRTVVIKSSGHQILDKAVIDYCAGLTFNPAIRDGEPVESRIIWEVNFNFLDQKWNTRDYLLTIDALYIREGLASHDEKFKIESDILKRHSDFIKQMNDAINFNNVVEKVIRPQLLNQWKKDWDTWPL